MAFVSRPAYARKRPAPRHAPGAPRLVSEDIVWTRIVQPREKYRVIYRDRDNLTSDRTIELQKIGHMGDLPYLGVMHAGKFKTLRSDRIVAVLEQLSTGHPPSIRSQPTYTTQLPKFPLPNAVYKMPTVAAGPRTWTVDLNKYTCTCPEKRIRAPMGYEPGTVGYACPHMARAILDYLPTNAGWDTELLTFLKDSRKMHIDNLA